MNKFVKYDVINVVDIETTCWENGKLPAGQKREIIEIGICHLDSLNSKIIKREGIIVKPENSKISEYCKNLTTLTQEDVDNGISLEGACKILKKKYKSERKAWISWGDDKTFFENECNEKNVKYPFGTCHINLSAVFSILTGRENRVGMSKILTILNIPQEGISHRGVDDAYNTAMILLELKKEQKRAL